MGRIISDVITEIKNSIPNDILDKSYYHEQLDWILDSSMYRAPETVYLNWEDLSEFVSDLVHITPETNLDEVEEWKLEIIRILTDKETIEEVKKLHKEKL